MANLTPSAFMPYPSRRSVVHSTNGMVACTQPLAAQAGLNVLRAGGNAADAAVAVAACLNVTEPTSTGIGGDAFCLFFDSKTSTVRALNASGRSPAALTREKAMADLSITEEDVKANPFTRIPMGHAHSVTVPGAAAGWVDAVKKFGSGKVGMSEVLCDAIRLCDEGFPVSELSSTFWKECAPALHDHGENGRELLKDGKRAPEAGEIMTMKGLGETFRALAREGKKGFYEGRVAEEIVKVVQEAGGCMTLDDLKRFGETGAEEVEPLKLDWNGMEVWECPPNGQGIVALMTLGIIEALEERKVIPKLGKGPTYAHNSTEYLHLLIETLRISFSDGHWWVSDPSETDIPLDGLLSKKYLHSRSTLFSPTSTAGPLPHGSPAMNSTDTVYFSVIDAQGNGCSFINSTFAGFGSGLVPRTCTFPLQCRGSGFSFIPDSPNVLAPNKRPYHTIIPGLLTTPLDSYDAPAAIDNASLPPTRRSVRAKQAARALTAVFGVMGGFMQPQGHVQVLLNLYKFGMNPQEALDAPRLLIGRNYDPKGDLVSLEEGIGEEVAEGLRRLGHNVKIVKGWERGHFGRGQCIVVREEEEGGKRVLSAGSDMRGDGCAVGW